ncbi:hypothetical protein LPTSP4_19450 [Leptospira ryugenii]|uniref:Uncharacterized protein n=1 Tax=Leptospira ryugenii TaxID=1917863 RepID=A0A2P2E0K4_9LEPT|nr:hypothetical protein LPTSP4_19450 [Leptospira ryugenii]
MMAQVLGLMLSPAGKPGLELQDVGELPVRVGVMAVIATFLVKEKLEGLKLSVGATVCGLIRMSITALALPDPLLAMIV